MAAGLSVSCCVWVLCSVLFSKSQSAPFSSAAAGFHSQPQPCLHHNVGGAGEGLGAVPGKMPDFQCSSHEVPFIFHEATLLIVFWPLVDF